MVARIWEQTRNLDNGVTERAKLGGIWGQTRCSGDRTLDLRTWPSAHLPVEAGCGTRIWGQARYLIYRSGTFNVKRSNLNVQWW